MSVGSISNSSPPQAVQSTPESAEPKKAGPDHDGDKDDQGAKAAAPAGPSVNLQGQVVGQQINVKA